MRFWPRGSEDAAQMGGKLQRRLIMMVRTVVIVIIIRVTESFPLKTPFGSRGGL